MDGKKRSHSSSRDDASSSSGDDSSVQRHLSGHHQDSDTPAESYYSSHIASVCAAMNTEAEKRMSPFEKLMLEKRRETNSLKPRSCRKKRREEINTMEQELRRLKSETEELTAEKARLQAELQQEVQEVANIDSANTPRSIMSSQTYPGPALSSNYLSHIMNLQEQQQFQQMMQLRPPATLSSDILFNQGISSPPNAFTAIPLGYEIAPPSMASTLPPIIQAQGLDLSQNLRSRAALSSLQTPNQSVDDVLARLPILQSNQQSNPRLHHLMGGGVLSRFGYQLPLETAPRMEANSGTAISSLECYGRVPVPQPTLDAALRMQDFGSLLARLPSNSETKPSETKSDLNKARAP